MKPEHPDYPLFRSFVDGQLTEPFYARYVRFMSKSASDISGLLSELGGPLTGAEARQLDESSQPESREGLARTVRRMTRSERAAFAELVLAGAPAEPDRPT